MIALQTNSRCDECGEPAIRETDDGAFFCAAPLDAPCGTAANNNGHGAFCVRPLCTRCPEPAFFRLKGGDLCSACFAISNSFASTPQDAKVTAAVPSALPQVAAAVTPPSKEPDALALLFCAPLRRSSDITKGDRSGTETTALETLQRVEPARDIESTLGGACGSERDGFGATNSDCGGGESRPAWGGFAQSLHTGDVEAGVASGPQDSIPALPQGGSPVTVGGLLGAPAVTPIFDLETDALVSGLEAGWTLDRRNSQTLRVVAASDSAENSKSISESRA